MKVPHKSHLGVQPSPVSRSSELPSLVSSPSEPLKQNPHQPLIPYLSRLNKEKLQDKSDIQVHKSSFQMIKNFINISLVKLSCQSTIKMLKDLLSDKEKLLVLANTSLTENCLSVLLKKLPEKLRDPGKFLIPYYFPEFEKCMALADLGASINLMPLFVWKKLMLPKLVPTRMTIELANRSIAYPSGIAEDVFVQVGKFTFSADFFVVNYDVNPRVLLILGRPFLRTTRALVDVYREKLILRDGDEKLIFHAENTARHPNKHGKKTINMINFIDITCEDHFDEVLKILKSIHCLSDSTTPFDLVVESLSSSHIPYGDSDSLMEETDTLLSHFNDYSPDYETFCFDIEEKSSGKEKSSGNSTSHSDLSLLEYESYHFDLLIDPLPPADRSDFYHEEFADELAHIISPPEIPHDLEDLRACFPIPPNYAPRSFHIPSDESKVLRIEKRSKKEEEWMERGFLSQKGSRGGRGVKEKSLNTNSMNTSRGMGVSTKSGDTMNEDALVGGAPAIKEGLTPSVVALMMEKDKLSYVEDTTIGSFPPLSTQGTTTAGNAPGKSSYANVTCKPSGKKVNVRTLFTPGGNRIDVVVPVDSIRAISERFANTAYGFFIGKKVACHVVANYGRSSYARVMIELRADMELKDNIVVAMPKITRKGHYTCDVEKKTSTASSSGNKKKGVEPTIEVCNSNPFDVLNLVNNDVEFGTNGGTTNLVNNGATSSGSSFMNVDNSSSGTTPIIEKIGKFEDLLTSGQAILVDKVNNPLKNVEFPGEYDSEDEVASFDNDTARSMTYKKVGFGIQILLKQWRDSYGNGDYDDDPYDDDMYEGQDLFHELQAICDNLDIRVRGRKKK
ncbi:reverse transcriptase domain-containing protein [Tanacetum coccineum]